VVCSLLLVPRPQLSNPRLNQFLNSSPAYPGHLPAPWTAVRQVMRRCLLAPSSWWDSFARTTSSSTCMHHQLWLRTAHINCTPWLPKPATRTADTGGRSAHVPLECLHETPRELMMMNDSTGAHARVVDPHFVCAGVAARTQILTAAYLLHNSCGAFSSNPGPTSSPHRCPQPRHPRNRLLQTSCDGWQLYITVVYRAIILGPNCRFALIFVSCRKASIFQHKKLADDRRRAPRVVHSVRQ
jgi:hypothetical protein